jgi:hypothetical protein
MASERLAEIQARVAEMGCRLAPLGADAHKLLKMTLELLAEVRRLNAELDTANMEIERLNGINLLELHQIGESMDMAVAGIPAKTFMAALVKLFETSRATNYITVTADYRKHHYGITIQKADGELTPEEHIKRLNEELAAVTRERDAAVRDIGQIMRACPTDYRPCDWCSEYDNGVCENREIYAGCIVCEPKWRGPCEANAPSDAEGEK